LLQATKKQLLRKAAELMGTDELAVRLKIPQHLLEAWMNGHTIMPDRKLALLANVLEQFSTKP
jgi:hypothetical protein